MGNASSENLCFKDLKKLLTARGSQASEEQIDKFLEFVIEVCPWFPEEGTVSLETWEIVGEHLLDFYTAHGPQWVPIETFGLWASIRDCLDFNETLPFAAFPADRKGEGAGNRAENGAKSAGGFSKGNKKPVYQESLDESWKDLNSQDQTELEDKAAKYD